MITGDSVKTAEVIARAVNIHEGTEPDFPVLTGKEFEAMTEAQRRVSLSHRKKLGFFSRPGAEEEQRFPASVSPWFVFFFLSWRRRLRAHGTQA